MNISEFIPAAKPKKKAKPPYRKPNSIKEFELEHKRWYYSNRNIPVELQTKSSFRDDTGNALSKIILEWLRVHDHFGARINTQGNYSPKLKRFIKSGSTVGMADLTAVIAGKHISIEVKAGRDRARPEQLKIRNQIQSAGGIYIFVHSFDDFLQQIKEII